MLLHRRYGTFFYQWQRLGLPTQDVTPADVFGLHLPYVPTTMRTNVATLFGHLTREQRSDIQSCCHELLEEHWKLGVTHTLQAIWTRKCRCRDITLDNTIFRAKVLLQGRLQEGRMTLRDITMETTTNEAILAAATVIFTSFADTSLDAEPVLCTPSGTVFCVLFFDGEPAVIQVLAGRGPSL